MAKAIVPVSCVAKSSGDVKKFWASKGLNVDECMARLQYLYLAGMEDTDTGRAIKAEIQACMTKIAGILEAKLPAGAVRDTYLEGIAVLENMTVKQAFGKSILATAVRNISGLEFPKATPAAGTDDEEDAVGAIEL